MQSRPLKNGYKIGIMRKHQTGFPLMDLSDFGTKSGSDGTHVSFLVGAFR